MAIELKLTKFNPQIVYFNSIEEMKANYKYIGVWYPQENYRYFIPYNDIDFFVRPGGAYFIQNMVTDDELRFFAFETKEELLEWMKEGAD